MLKQACQAIIDDVSQQFLKKKHSIYKTLLLYNKSIDKLILQYYPNLTAIAVIAIGGYGRQDRALFSDLDLLFLAKSDEALNDLKLINFIQELHDLPLKIGYSTHTLISLFKYVQNDLNLLTAILDARFLCGDFDLFQQFKQQVDLKENLPAAPDFITKKYQEQWARDDKYPINQQPDIKNTIGNLRYLQSIHWILLYTHPMATLRYFVEQNYITQDELNALTKAHRLLSAIRFYLHILYQREQNTLLLDKQLLVAHFFGFKHKKTNKAIEQFMQHYYNSIRHVKLINRIIFGELIAQYAKNNDTQLNEQFRIDNGILKHRSINYPEREVELIEPFSYFCQYPQIKALDGNILRNNMRLIKAMDKRNFVTHQALQMQFLHLFNQQHNLKSALSIMMDIGLIEKIIPEFARSKGQMQFDLYHQYTVDRHTIEVINNLYRMHSDAYQLSFPLAYKLMACHPEPKLLYISALFHDIGKGSGVDHSKFGARLIQKYGHLWQLKQDEMHLVTWLVKHHLAFSRAIKKTDIFDAEVIRQFALFCQSQYYLDSLFLLTIADIQGTNRNLWTNWQQTMFINFYQNICHQFGQLVKLTVKEQVKQIQLKLLSLLGENEQIYIKEVWQALPARYFTEQSTAALTWQSNIITQEIDNCADQIVKFFCQFNEKLQQSMLLILAPISSLDLSSICYVLYKENINITDASFFQLPNKIMLYQFTLTDLNHVPLKEPTTLQWLKQHLDCALIVNKVSYHPNHGQALATSTLKRIKNKVQILSPKHKTYSQIIVKCADRPGLLAALCYFLETHHLYIIRARIHTAAHRVEDTFYVTDQAYKQITSQGKKQLLVHRFLKYLSSFSVKR
ncbi:HD domain-containing protein [Fastidiosibacter lacustris]|uniref:[protein-PII] uridylyltransferase family protein n=1 Tax=Fastidiosibacter lacustris TaxID=2056695 RepID=UPI000E3471C2|nr:HD domain-containing protein [Fastidiosibacter lacustris]